MAAPALERNRTEVLSATGREFTVSIERDRHWWIGLVEELPGCGSQGRTLRELREMLEDAIQAYLIVRDSISAGAESEGGRT